MELNPDFSDLLRAFLSGGVEFLVAGAHALSVRDRARATKDLDVWIRPDRENARRVCRALAASGAPLVGEAWPKRIEVERDGLLVPFIGVDEFLRNKDATGRDQDRVDAARVRRRLERE